MARVLLIGIDPDTVDFSDPTLPRGLDADKIRAGIEASLARLAATGHVASQLYVSSAPDDLAALADRLTGDAIECVTIGGGITRPPQNVELFEKILNVILGATPPPRVALVLGPENAPAAVDRVMRSGDTSGLKRNQP